MLRHRKPRLASATSTSRRTPCLLRSRKPFALEICAVQAHIKSMQSDNPIIADFVKLANAAAGTLAGMTREARDAARERIREALGGLDFVSREEFDAVKHMAATARERVETLEARLAALEEKTKG